MEMCNVWYNDNENTFEDDNGNVVNDISNLLPRDVVFLYKKVGGTYYAKSKFHPDIMYEIDFPIRAGVRQIYYDVEENVMYDEDGKIIFNIFSILEPNELLLFKQKKECVEFCSKAGDIVELLYPEQCEQE